MEKIKTATAYGVCLDSAIRDEVGGVHEDGLGWSPNGVFCGECGNITCKDCPMINNTEIGQGNPNHKIKKEGN